MKSMNSTTLSVLMTLLEKRKVSRGFLAEKHELSKRTISRHIDILLESGVPVLSVTGHNGGYMLPDDYTVERMFFSDAEKKRITDCLKTTEEKYRDSLNVHISQKIAALGKSPPAPPSGSSITNNIIVDAGPWGAPNRYSVKIDIINSAIDARKTLMIKYTDKHEAYSERFVDPYNLALKQGVWYLYGFCRSRQDFRLFKLSRVNYLIVTDKSFTRRADADASGKLDAQFGEFDETNIVVEFSSLILSQVEEWLGTDSVYEDGLNYRAAATVYSGNELLSKILSFGSGLKVIAPAELKEEVLTECKRMIMMGEE